ncbi:MAG: hypothetical protein ACLP0J_00190 [Solirubrobacteraceae bacterium]
MTHHEVERGIARRSRRVKLLEAAPPRSVRCRAKGCVTSRWPDRLEGHQALAVAGGFNVIPNVTVTRSAQADGFLDWQVDFKNTLGSGQAQASVICIAAIRTPAS